VSAIPQPARDALKAVRKALGTPHATTVGDGEKRTAILIERSAP
jgi:hypothetical protein